MSCADGKGAYACINPVGGDINVKLVKSVRDNGTLLLFANLGSNLFQVRTHPVFKEAARLAAVLAVMAHVNSIETRLLRYLCNMASCWRRSCSSTINEAWAST